MLCPYCESRTVRQRFAGDNGRVYQCRSCSGIFNSLKVDADEFYDQKYFEDNYVSIVAQQKERFESYAEIIKKFVSEGSVLDYGCGIGVFLSVAEEKGFKGNLGIDVSPEALSIARKIVGPQTQLSALNEEIEPEFSVLSFIDSIAHIENIREVFRKLISENLKKDGIVFIRTPCLNKLYFRYVSLLAVFLPKRYLEGFYFLSNRYLLFNEVSAAEFFKSFGLEISFLKKERAFDRPIKVRRFKDFIKYLIAKKIPQMLNPMSSMVILAKRARP